MADWTFLSNHAHVLICVARDPSIRVRDIATSVGVTERAAHRILSDLVEGGYLSRERVGARNRYALHPDRPLRHPVESGHSVRDLLEAVAADRPATDDVAADG